MTPSSIGASSLNGDDELMTVNSDGSRSSVLIVKPARNSDHLDGVEDALAPEAVGVNGLVGERQHVEQRVEMADGGVNVGRLDRIAADEMNRIETLPEADEVLIVPLVAGPQPAGAIKRIGGARHGAESDVAPANREIARRFARVQLELLRREADVRLDEIGVEADATRGWIDVRAGALQHCARFVVQEIDADLLEHFERRLMDRFEFVTGDKVERRERRLRLAQGLSGASASAARRRRRPVSCGGESVVIVFPGFLSASAHGAGRDSSRDLF
jgi:hypothetical protein